MSSIDRSDTWCAIKGRVLVRLVIQAQAYARGLLARRYVGRRRITHNHAAWVIQHWFKRSKYRLVFLACIAVGKLQKTSGGLRLIAKILRRIKHKRRAAATIQKAPTPVALSFDDSLSDSLPLFLQAWRLKAFYLAWARGVKAVRRLQAQYRGRKEVLNYKGVIRAITKMQSVARMRADRLTTTRKINSVRTVQRAVRNYQLYMYQKKFLSAKDQLAADSEEEDIHDEEKQKKLRAIKIARHFSFGVRTAVENKDLRQP